MRLRCWRNCFIPCLLLAVAGGLTGCTTYNEQNRFAEPWMRGDLATAEKETPSACAPSRSVVS